MNECLYCGDPDLAFDADPEDDDTVACRSGCGWVFDADEIDPDELRFGFHIVTLDDIAAEADEL
jgi:hypothetical protein